MDIIRFNAVEFILNPFVLMFVTIIIGLLAGKIRFGKFSLGTSGVLFAGLVIGWVVYKFAEGIYDAGDETAAGMDAVVQIMEDNGGKVINSYFFSAALIIFVASVGLLASKDLGIVLKKYGIKFVILAFLITFTGAASTYICTAFCNGTNQYAVAGVYTGALTSSPGLASALETAEIHAEDLAENFSSSNDTSQKAVIRVLELNDRYKGLEEENVQQLTEEMKTDFVNQATGQVGTGYAVGYPFGVIVVILAVNFLSGIFKIDVEEEKRKYREEMLHNRRKLNIKEIAEVDFSISSFMIICAAGYFLGSLQIYMGPLGYVSLESTGGVLTAALILGYIGKIGPLNFRMNEKILEVIRELALSFFMAIVGLNYGYGAMNAITGSGLTLAAVSILVSALSVMIGFLTGRYVFHLNWIMLSGAICGGMTSTPGLGAAASAIKSNEPGAGYGATYPFALLGMVIFTIILHKLPLL